MRPSWPLFVGVLISTGGCLGVPQSVPPPPTVTSASVVASPMVASLVASPGVVAAQPSPSAPPTALPAPTVAGPVAAAKPTAVSAVALPTVERSRASGSAGFLTPVELELEFAEPISSAEELNEVAEGLLQLSGIASVHADGARVSVRYDTTAVLPARIRDRLRELGHPAKAGTEVQNPGDAAD